MSHVIAAPGPEVVPIRPDGDRHRRLPTEGAQDVRVVLLCALTSLAVGLYRMGLRGLDLDATTGLGLISVLPVTTLLGLGLLVTAFVATLSLLRQRVWLLTVQLVLLVVLLHGLPMFVESEPRFAISWVHAGFVEFIDRTGTTAPALDCRWSWPGFFGLAAFWVGSGRLDALHSVLTVTPVIANLSYLIALGLLMSALRMTWQAKWLAAMLFCLLNWVGQDYFSPQGFTLLLYLLLLAFLVVWFRPPEHGSNDMPRVLRPARRAWRWLWGGAAPGELPARAIAPADRIVVFAVIVGLFVTITVCHQLTPFAALSGITGLVVARRCALVGLPVLFGVLVLAWISFMTQAYWGGHFSQVVSGVGDVGGTMSSSVADRASLGNAQHQLVVHARMLTTVLVFLIAGFGLFRRRRRGVEDRVLLVLIAAPIGLAFAQSYGGEMALRVYLFALAPACVLIALSLFPDPVARPSLLSRCVTGICVLGLLFCFLVTRYGNEAFERIPTGAVSAVRTVYENTSGDVTFLYVTAVPELDSTPFMPLGYRDVDRVRWQNTMAPRDPADTTAVLRALRQLGPGGYLITTRSQEAFVVYGQGYPTVWGDQFRRALAATPGIRVIVDNHDAAVYALDPLPGAVAKPHVAPPTGLQVWRTPWTPVGLGFLVLLLGILITRETWRIRLGFAGRKRLRPLTFAALPLLIGFVLVVGERFALLT